MKQISKKVLAFTTICFMMIGMFCIGSYAVSDQSSASQALNTAFQYPVTQEDAGWENLNTLEKKIEACEVPNGTVEHMTTKALVETVVNYPLIINIYAFNTFEDGIQSVSEYFNGLSELISRKDAMEELAAYSEQNDVWDENTDVSFYCAKDLLAYLESKMQNSTTSDIDPTNPPEGGGRAVDINTPGGNTTFGSHNLSWGSFEGLTYEKSVAIREGFMRTYESTVLLGEITPMYNSHSYAWLRDYQDDVRFICDEFPEDNEYTNYWLKTPEDIIDESSYVETDEEVGAIAYYTSDHSAVVYSLPSRGEPVVISKWGSNSLFRHELSDCPYGYGSVSYWVADY